LGKTEKPRAFLANRFIIRRNRLAVV